MPNEIYFLKGDKYRKYGLRFKQLQVMGAKRRQDTSWQKENDGVRSSHCIVSKYPK